MTNEQIIKTNKKINTFLQKGLALAMQYEKAGQHETASAVLAITSKLAYQQIQATGLQEAIRLFWEDRKIEAQNYN